jgi:hypothetical protein
MLFLCLFVSTIKSLARCVVYIVRQTVDLNVSSNIISIFQPMMMHGNVVLIFVLFQIVCGYKAKV